MLSHAKTFIIGAVLGAVFGALVLASPYLVYALQRYPSGLTRQQPAYSLRIARLILPWSDHLFGLRPLVAYSNGFGPYSIDDYVGLPLLAILFLLGVFTWKSKVTRLLVSAFFVVVALAAGPDLIITDRPAFALPWGRLWNLPVARSAEANRFIVFSYLVLAIVLALWLAAPVGNRLLRTARWGLVPPWSRDLSPGAGNKPVVSGLEAPREVWQIAAERKCAAFVVCQYAFGLSASANSVLKPKPMNRCRTTPAGISRYCSGRPRTAPMTSTSSALVNACGPVSGIR